MAAPATPAAAQRSPATTVLYAGAALLLAPLASALLVLFLALWLTCTLGGSGPLLQLFYARRDAATLAACCAPGAPVAHMAVRGRRLAVRWTPAAAGGAHPLPVVIPNGLGATLVTISALHDLLAAQGFAVLSYDRAGVGMSDALSGKQAARGHATAAESVADMHAVMEALAPGAKWLLVGPSMGSIVAQCFAAAHPDAVAGILNLDGLPFPFAGKRRRFELAAIVYKAYAAIVWTGLLRLGLACATAKLAPLASRTFPLAIVCAQMNERNFFASLAREMLTMMDCCDAATAAWGPAFDLPKLPPAQLAALLAAAPAACGDAVCWRDSKMFKWRDVPRSAEEPYADTITAAEAHARAIAPMLATHAALPGPPPPLPAVWQRLVVRAMSARNYDFGMGPLGDAFYDQEMRNWAGAEHAMHVLLARAGARTVFPLRSHTSMFFALVPFAAREVVLMEREVLAGSVR